jgi:tetratricopeptide (TPR) repeat protein
MARPPESWWKRLLGPAVGTLTAPGAVSATTPAVTASTALADQLARARAALAEGRAQDVIDDLETSLEVLTVLESATWSTLGTAYDQLGRATDRDRAYKRAVRMFEQANVQLDPGQIIAVVPALVARGKRAKAIETLRAVAVEQPDDVDVVRVLAQQLEDADDRPGAAAAHVDLTHRLRGGADEAVEHLRRAVDLDADKPEYRAELGRALIGTGDPTGAVEELRKAVAHLPESHQARAWLAEALEASGKPQEALSLADAFLVSQPADLTAQYVRGRALFSLGRAEEAASALAGAMAVPGLAPDVRARINLERGEVLGALRRYDEAIAAFDDVLATSPDNVKALLGRGKTRYAKSDFEHAAQDLADAAARATGDDRAAEIQALALLGDTLRLTQHYKEALAVLDRALAIEPESAFVLGTKGQVLSSLNERVEAEAALTASIAVDPMLPWVHASLAELYRLDDRADDALDELNRAAAGGDETAYTRGTRGQIFASRGRVDEAIDELRAAWTLDQAVWIADALAAALAERAQLGDIAEALAVIDHALSNEAAPRAMLAQKADLLRMSGQFVNALTAIDQYLSGLSASEDDTALATKAHILVDLRRSSEALELSELIISRNETYTFARYAKIRALVGLNDYDRAMTELDSLLHTSPADPFALRMKASLCCDLRRFERALEVLREDLYDSRSEALTNALTGYCLRRMRPPDLEAAVTHLRVAVLEDPNDLWYKIELADTLDETLADADEAERLRHEVLARVRPDAPASASDAAFAGWAALALGNAHEAAARLRDAVQIDPGELGTRFALALALLQAGPDERDQAEDEYEGTVSLADRQPSRERRDAVVTEALDDLHRAQAMGRIGQTEASERIEALLTLALAARMPEG